MKSMTKMKKVLLSILVITLIGLTGLTAQAANKTIQLGSSKKITTGYIAGVTFSTKQTTGGQYLYCVDMHRKTATNTSATLVKEMDRGIAEIIRNGYPNKSITGDAEKDYYITQTAVWWYLDDTTGSQNLGEQFKKTGSDAYGMRSKVKELVSLGKQSRNAGQPETQFEITISDSTLTLDGDYYVSKPISISKINNISSYTVVVENAPDNTLVVDQNGNKIERFTKDTIFVVKVPAKNLDQSKYDIKFTAKGVGYNYRAYEYQPSDRDMQNVALLEKQTTTIPSSVTLTIDSSKVSVTKVDSKTGNAIAGATLVLRDSAGKEVTKWTSTTSAHVIRNLGNGTYTIEETEAPNGYVLNKRITTFTLSDTNRVINIKIENAPKSIVVSISKVDSATKALLPGATLVIKNEAGQEVKRFTTTSEATVITDLEYGTYTVYEETAPAGYIKSNQTYTFTLDENHLSYQLTVENTKETVVPDTASTSVLLTILGIAITAAGIGFVYKNGKKAK